MRGECSHRRSAGLPAHRRAPVGDLALLSSHCRSKQKQPQRFGTAHLYEKLSPKLTNLCSVHHSADLSELFLVTRAQGRGRERFWQNHSRLAICDGFAEAIARLVPLRACTRYTAPFADLVTRPISTLCSL